MRKTFVILLISFLLSGICYGATISYECNYMGCIKQIDFPAKDLRIVLIDTRSLMVKPFADFATANNLIVKPYGLAAVKISTGAVLKMFFFNDLASLKDKVVNYCQTNNITFAWKQKQGSIKDWWLQKQ